MNQNMENDSNHFWKISKFYVLLYKIIKSYIILNYIKIILNY